MKSEIFTILFFVILFSTVTGFSQVKEGKWRTISQLVDRKLNFEIGFGYDDNIFRYSPEDIAKFVNNLQPQRFSNVESNSRA